MGGIDYSPPPGGSVSAEEIQVAVNAYLTVHPPGVPDHADLPDRLTSGHPASTITGLATVATSGSYTDLTNQPELVQGPPGTDGTDGVDGLSAYQVAQAGGFVGTQADWLASLVGPAGRDGVDGTNGTNGTDGTNGLDGAPGAPGADGADGLSAYQIAVNNGFVGTLPQWLASLQGADGEDGAPGAKGDQGDPGTPGAPGTTDYLELTNRPTLGTAAAQDVAAFMQNTTGSDATHLWVGTAAEYAAIGSPSATTIYVVTA